MERILDSWDAGSLTHKIDLIDCRQGVGTMKEAGGGFLDGLAEPCKLVSWAQYLGRLTP